ncbi:autophagy-related 4B (yeast), isoform CRA_c [Rattus norvegicus]|uniref:Autophagy-related 4B (Yeast), isoform CRA_c n=1 Tax=Rattus norvegicus TaxID=10116 RepID=A6JR33_RAT|nr:autophagy-related 4B (yeast), isoform CRA_c [Rattus norvegicus]
MGEAGATPDTAALSSPRGSKRSCLSTSDMLMTYLFHLIPLSRILSLDFRWGGTGRLGQFPFLWSLLPGPGAIVLLSTRVLL